MSGCQGCSNPRAELWAGVPSTRMIPALRPPLVLRLSPLKQRGLVEGRRAGLWGKREKNEIWATRNGQLVHESEKAEIQANEPQKEKPRTPFLPSPRRPSPGCRWVSDPPPRAPAGSAASEGARGQGRKKTACLWEETLQTPGEPASSTAWGEGSPTLVRKKVSFCPCVWKQVCQVLLRGRWKFAPGNGG